MKKTDNIFWINLTFANYNKIYPKQFKTIVIQLTFKSIILNFSINQKRPKLQLIFIKHARNNKERQQNSQILKILKFTNIIIDVARKYSKIKMRCQMVT